MIRTIVAILALAFATLHASAQDFSAEELARRTIERRAVEAVIWGMPAVNYDLMLQEMLNKTDGKVNQIVYWGRPLDWHNQTLTPNPDAIYFMAFFNTKDVGPIVIDVPPAGDGGSINGNIVDVWQMPLEDAGLCRRRQGRRRQVPDPAARLRRRGAGRVTSPLRSGHLRRLRAAALQPQEPQRRRCREVGRLRQADQGLSAVAGGNPPPDRVHRRGRCRVRFHHPLRRELLRVARPHRAERAVARPRPGDDRSAQVDRHREGQAVRSRCDDQGSARRRRPRSAGTGSRPSTTQASRHSARAAAGACRRRRNSSRPRRSASPIPTPIPSMLAASPTPTPLSASSAWAPASST